MKKGFFLTIDESGRIIIPPDLRDKFGLKPGGRFFCEIGDMPEKVFARILEGLAGLPELKTVFFGGFDFFPCSTCNSCELPEENLEDCFVSEHPACGGCLWAQGFITCP